MKRIERFEDMSRRGRLAVHQQIDGDVIITVIPDPDERPRHQINSAEFCTLTGGGQSPNTRKALQDLIEAMEKDNKENPQNRD
uniref:Uncharacterized protein n=1 Tax=viral metagenome TaxID=1070528 RepID=A0A6M3L1S0_9ZZZZ